MLFDGYDTGGFHDEMFNPDGSPRSCARVLYERISAVGDEELRQLASRRANAVKDALLQSGKIEASRVFIVEPKRLTPEKKDKVRDTRVEFRIA